MLLTDAGPRYHEIVRLEWQQIDLKQKTIDLWRGQTGSESDVYMTDGIH